MTFLTFYGGVNEIGGNKILLKDKNTKVFLDFGMSFASESEYFSGYLCPRAVNGVGDYLEFNILPKLKGLYAKDQLKHTKFEYTKPQFDGVVLTHSHIDHVGYIQFIDEKIPIYLGETAKLILESLEETGSCYFGEHKFKTFRTGDRIKIGSLEIEPIHVDHSIPGAYGFIICTSSGSIIYTGDLRMHGPMGKMTIDFIERAKETEPVAMISEGTRVALKTPYSIHSEAEVKNESSKVIARTNKLVIAAFYGRDIDRFNTFYQIAKEEDRKFVIPTRLAYLLTKLKNDKKLKIPDIEKDDNILVYKKRKKTGEFDEKDYYKWERPFLDKAVNFKYIHKNQSKILLNLDLTGFAELIDIKPDGGHFIYSMSEPFSEEDIEDEIMHNWLEHYNLELHQIHASGHASKGILKMIVDKIQPNQLFPIHTEYPELFAKLMKDKVKRIVLPKKKEDYTF